MATNREIARVLRELAVLTELDEGSPQSFRARAYHDAVRVIEGLDAPVAGMSEAELTRLKGVGKGIARKVRQYVESGRIDKLEELRTRYPPGFRELSRLPSLGPKTLALLRRELGIESLEDLRAAVEARALREVRGLGPKTEENLARAIERLGLDDAERRTPMAEALPVAEEVVESLRSLPQVERAYYAGSLRRFRETIGDLDVLVASREPGPVADRFCSLSLVAEVRAHGERKCSVLTDRGLQVDLRVVAPEQFGAALLYFTGSQAHNIRLRQLAIARGWTLNEYGLFEAEGGRLIAAATEEEVYAALDLPWIPPPIREDDGELEAAAAGRLPELVTEADLYGDLHLHTDLSGDGWASLEEMLEAALRRGHRLLATTDHAEGLAVNGVSREEMVAQRRRLEQLRLRHPEVILLHGAELNIGPEGELDYDEAFLASFDWTVASIHSHFGLPPAAQTQRLLRAIRHPAVRAIGHLIGRRIGRRPGIELEVDPVLDALAETGTALEVNSHLDRLDAPADILRRAGRRGVVFVIDSDAHVVSELDGLRFGVLNAQRGWVERSRVVNAWEPDRFLEWLRRPAGAGPRPDR